MWAIAVAHPVLDVLRQNPEFFVAHRAAPADVIWFAIVLVGVVPLLLAGALAAFERASSAGGRVARASVIGLLAAAIASQALARGSGIPLWAHAVAAAAAAGGAGWLYLRAAPARLFVTMLAPAAIVVPAYFLLHPSMASIVGRRVPGAHAAAPIEGRPAPVVMIVFDQLPLTSLLDASGQIDRHRFPAFARLADRATWYRNATTVADLTGWALPPIVTGLQPRATRAPTARDYPLNLFTWLGSGYRLEVVEPITQLCPEHLCPSARVPTWVQLAGMTLDAGVVYLHIVLPPALRASLPPLTEHWKNFVQAREWQRRWVSARDADRRQAPEEFIASIDSDDPQPTLYFLHALLPHEPYVYSRSGDQYTDQTLLVGLKNGRWTSDKWPVAQAYRRHLLQVEYVDTILGRVLDRLDTASLFDPALIVVTSDHGVSFRAGHPFKGIEGTTLPDIMPVPLLIKAPGQQRGSVSDRNVETVDILPTLASILGIPLTWEPEGRSALSGGESATKTVYYSNADLSMTVDAAALAARRDEAVARKIALFGAGAGWQPMAVAHDDLLGRRLDDLEIAGESELRSVVYAPATPPQAGPSEPAFLTGRIVDAFDRGAEAEIAIAIGGEIRATTRTYRADDGAAHGAWAAFVDTSPIDGDATLDILVIRTTSRGRVLERAFRSRTRPVRLNLASEAASSLWAVRQSGLTRSEGGPIPYRWITGPAEVETEMDRGARPRSLQVGLAVVRPGTSLRLRLNECTLFAGRVDASRWYRTFSLDTCPAGTLEASRARIVLDGPEPSAGDGAPEKVAVESIALLPDAWPPADTGAPLRGRIQVVGDASRQLTAGETIQVFVDNDGETAWLPPADAPDGTRAVEISLRWRSPDGGQLLAEQRLQLPRAIYPEDRAAMPVPLFPPRDEAGAGPWRLEIVPVARGGEAVAVDRPCIVQVAPR